MKKFLFGLCFGMVLSLAHAQQETPKSIVERYGQLRVKGNYILSQYGDTVQLRGMSMFWSQWMGKFYNPSLVKWLKDDWKITVIRIAMGVESGGYLDNSFEEKKKVYAMVDAAVANGIYVIIDYHSHEAHMNPEPAKKFFLEVSKKYGHLPNVLYEIYNEPLQDISWHKDIKPYSEAVIKVIRSNDPDNIVICGTRQWSQLVGEAAMNPVKDSNTVYTLHFYAASHGQYLRDEAKAAMAKGICIFVSEFGTCEYTGNGTLDYMATQAWFEFMDQYKISWCNWSVSDKEETASIIKPGAKSSGKWRPEDLTPSGEFIRDELWIKNGPLLK
ncbi:MAG: glycoside hydrolase family 5 protein [Cytophagaceae bacterium]|jgi:endoglucanase|nr:glycoside hydrolase family 5 protein [Cytophagaceae bacterium]